MEYPIYMPKTHMLEKILSEGAKKTVKKIKDQMIVDLKLPKEERLINNIGRLEEY